MGVLISHSGDWDRGIDIVRRSMELNPHHPGWYHFPQFFDHYRKREFDQALATAKRINMPEDFWMHAVTAAASGRLGLKEEANTALELLRSLMPEFRDELGPTLGLWILDAAVVEQVVEGVAEAEALVGGAQQTTVAIAVLPFTDMSPAKDQDYFCEGMAEEIMNALVPVDGIRVASRTSAFAPGTRATACRRSPGCSPLAMCSRAAFGRRQPPACYRPVDRRGKRLPTLVRALRPGAGGRLLCAGRDRRRCR